MNPEKRSGKIDVTLTEMTPFQKLSAFDQPQETSNAGDSTNVGKFETKGVDGKDYTEKVFSDYDLTLRMFYYLVFSMSMRFRNWKNSMKR